MSRVLYSLAIVSLMFTMVSTKLDNAKAMGFVSQFMENFGKDHWTDVKWIMRYLRGTSYDSIFYGLTYLQIEGFPDLILVEIKMDKRCDYMIYFHSYWWSCKMGI